MPYADLKKRNCRRFDDPADGLRVRLANLKRGHRKRGKGDPTLTPGQLAIARQKAAEAIADAVSRAMMGIGHRQLGRRLGRDMGRTLAQIYREADTRVSTLADIAEATGCELVVELRPRGALHRAKRAA
jgi:hypothetical protein